MRHATNGGNLPNMAKKKGRGRPTNPNSKSGKIRALLRSDLTVAQIAKKTGATVALVYNVKAKASGAKKKKRASAGKKRGPGRPRKAKGMDALGGILAAVQSAEKDRVRMRAALEKISAIIQNAI